MLWELEANQSWRARPLNLGESFGFFSESCWIGFAKKEAKGSSNSSSFLLPNHCRQRDLLKNYRQLHFAFRFASKRSKNFAVNKIKLWEGFFPLIRLVMRVKWFRPGEAFRAWIIRHRAPMLCIMCERGYCGFDPEHINTLTGAFRITECSWTDFFLREHQMRLIFLFSHPRRGRVGWKGSHFCLPLQDLIIENLFPAMWSHVVSTSNPWPDNESRLSSLACYHRTWSSSIPTCSSIVSAVSCRVTVTIIFFQVAIGLWIWLHRILVSLVWWGIHRSAVTSTLAWSLAWPEFSVKVLKGNLTTATVLSS